MRSVLRILVLTGLLAITPVIVHAATNTVSESYSSSDQLQQGSIVSLLDAQAQSVRFANTETAAEAFGVVVQNADSLVALNPDEKAFQVAVQGQANVLVSTINGDISSGDKITASPFNGIGMRLEDGGHYIGVATAAFSKQSESAKQRSVTDVEGVSQTMSVGYVTVSIKPGFEQAATPDAEGLQKIAVALTGRTIPLTRLIAALIVAIVSLIVVVTLVYTAIYGSLVSIGRNPLAKSAIYRTLSRVLVMAVGVVLIALALLYLLLQ